MGTESTFYYPVVVHKDTNSNEALAPVLTALPLTALSEEVVMLQLGVGNFGQGIYVYDGRWKYSAPMYEVTSNLTRSGTIDVYTGLISDITVDSSAVVYRNGQLLNSNVLSAGSAAYIVFTPGAGVPPKPPGPDLLAYTAVTDVSGHRVMKIAIGGVTYASSDDITAANLVLGITIGSAVAGAIVDVQLSGELTEPSWNWTPGLPVFCGISGYLTQDVPTSGFVIIVGQVTTPQTIIVTIKTPIIIGD